MSTKLITDPETWYSLKLGEIASIESHGFSIERVPGGWLYWYDDKATFIPFNPEFYKNESQACNDKRYVERICPRGGLL